MALFTLPNELVLYIVQQLRDSGDNESLLRLALTCKALRSMADSCLYASFLSTTRSRLRLFKEALQLDPNRTKYVQELALPFSTKFYDGDNTVPAPELRKFPNLRSFRSESPECQPWAEKGRELWKLDFSTYMKAFEDASLMSTITRSDRPLQNLTTCKYVICFQLNK
jgi:hypothetical protein